MIKRYLVWYHRRRMGYHKAMADYPESLWHKNYLYHMTWRDWHKEQLERITKL